MRVVAGVAGGLRLSAPPGRRLRPTSERVREAVFSSLGSQGAVEGARVLDLFAGTGAMGIEALSRGAATVTFVDADPAAVAAIKANLTTTGLEGARVVQADVERFLADPGGLRGPDEVAGHYDLVFCDPPYAFTDWPDLLAEVPGELVVVESRRPVDTGPGWSVVRTARYGDTTVTMARRAAGAEPAAPDPAVS
jgi:16S rRNA (guanine966-N2)-methyltransferase